jgi:hypothetical protein
MADHGGERVRTLGLRLDLRRWSGYPVVTILVDGEEIFARTGDRAYAGWHPALILDPDVAALLPTWPARRVGLYGEDSYRGPKDGCVAALIVERGDQVAWSDIRDFHGIYQQPTTEHDPGPGRGEFLSIPDLVFYAGQYRAEVARVTADPSWETDGLKAERLLRRYLTREQEFLAGLGWKLEFAQERRGGYRVVFRDAEDAQIVVDLATGLGTPEKQARAMAEFLLTTPPARWPVTHCSRCDSPNDSYPGSPPGEGDRAASLSHHPAHGQSTRGK